MALCPNCKSVNIVAKFCPSCGQKVNLPALSIWSLLSDFVSNFFNLESKLWRTLRDIWIPGKLTRAYVDGKRASYSNPLRIFVIVLVSFFTLLIILTREGFEDMDKLTIGMEKSVWKEEKVALFDSLAAKSKLNADSLSILRQKLFDRRMKAIDTLVIQGLNEEGQHAFQEIQTLKPDLNIFNQLKTLDSLMLINEFSKDTTGGYSIDLDEEQDFEIAGGLFADDFVKLTPEELKEKYGEGKLWREMGVVQLQKFFKHPTESIRFLIGNGFWAIVLMIIMIGLFFKMIYIRTKKPFAEHAIFHLYGHSRILLMAIIGMIFTLTFNLNTIWIAIVFCIGLVYLFLGMKRYYGQSGGKTFVKFAMTLFAYGSLIGVCFFVILGISFFAL